ncbi:SMI1/KNR4 family protein [Streptomyces sp. NBC_00154]|uniref:SMI1/KNR4 family protein n=1 Tax=Streptomyces sp. NBC_00154 TaxID=2975670 RepID=UPI0022580431|nr:SMI1/KNR4 family protein [Streptomyces sp. NBC_00154]MCX5315887.1 SMI1/KNR4 family protein [Streptomyces sp. NBC_00154]
MGEVGQAWQRVLSWLEVNAPVTASSVLPPVAVGEIDAAQERMGVVFPQELRAWLLITGLDEGPDDSVAGILPGLGGLLGLTAMESFYNFKMEIERDDPSDEPGLPFWHEQWVPIFSDSDACYGKFLDTRTGQIGSFGDGDLPSFGVHESLSALFNETANLMGQITYDAGGVVGSVQNGRLIWLSSPG